jgi:hypothetical protein
MRRISYEAFSLLRLVHFPWAYDFTLLVQASIGCRLMTKPLEFFSEMQHAAFEVSDHWITSRTIDQSICNLVFECLLPPFKIRNVIWFRHDSESLHGVS